MRYGRRLLRPWKMGKSVKSIRHWLEQDAGITVAITSLTSYISRIRRRESRVQHRRKSPVHETVPGDHPVVPEEPKAPMQPSGVHREPLRTADPIAQAMRALTKPRLDIRKLHGDGDPTGMSLI